MIVEYFNIYYQGNIFKKINILHNLSNIYENENSYDVADHLTSKSFNLTKRKKSEQKETIFLKQSTLRIKIQSFI